MNFNFDLNSYSLSSLESFFVSILLLFGFTFITLLLIKLLLKTNFLNSNSLLANVAIAPTLGAALLGPPLYSYFLFSKNTTASITLIAWTLASIGFLASVFGLLVKLKHWIREPSLRSIPNIRNLVLPKSINSLSILLTLILILMGFLSLSPPTDADELDYHLGVPLKILNTGLWVFAPEWFASRLAGMGEALITLGLSIGAQSFGSLLQFIGLMAITFILLDPSSEKNKSNAPLIYALIFCCSPVLLWLVSTSKPLLLPMAMTTLSLALLPPRKIDSNKMTLTHFTFACFLLCSATQMKFNFILSGSLVGIVWLYTLQRSKLLLQGLLIGLIISAIIILPPALWKSIHYGGNLGEGFLTLFPGNWPGYIEFKSMLTNYHDSNLPFPLSIFIVNNLGEVTTIIGIGAVVWILGIVWILRSTPTLSREWLIGIASITLVIAGSFLGQTAGRFYLEPLAWLLLALSSCPFQAQFFLKNRILRFGVYAQSCLTIVGAIICAYWLFPGSITNAWREEVLTKAAYGYAQMRWADAELPSNAIVLSELRSKALIPRKALSLDWVSYVNPSSKEALPYLKIIKENNPTHLISKIEPKISPWKNCLKENIQGPFSSQSAARNPFNRGQLNLIWIAEFDPSLLPQCIQL